MSAAVPGTLDNRLAAVRAAREACELVLAELLERTDDAVTAQDMAALQPEIQVARNTIDDSRQREIDLTAAGTSIAPLDAATEANLQGMGAKVDAATIRDMVADATLDDLAAILNTAIRINAIA